MEIRVFGEYECKMRVFATKKKNGKKYSKYKSSNQKINFLNLI